MGFINHSHTVTSPLLWRNLEKQSLLYCTDSHNKYVQDDLNLIYTNISLYISMTEVESLLTSINADLSPFCQQSRVAKISLLLMSDFILVQSLMKYTGSVVSLPEPTVAKHVTHYLFGLIILYCYVIIIS